MEVEDIHGIRPEFLERPLQLLTHDIRLVEAWLGGIPLCGNLQPAFLPACVGGELLLLSCNVDAGSVNLAVAALLEVVQMSLEFIQRCNSAASCLVRAIGHQTENHSGFGFLRSHLDRGYRFAGSLDSFGCGKGNWGASTPYL
jgi:hypothetical protein